MQIHPMPTAPAKIEEDAAIIRTCHANSRRDALKKIQEIEAAAAVIEEKVKALRICANANAGTPAGSALAKHLATFEAKLAACLEPLPAQQAIVDKYAYAAD